MAGIDDILARYPAPVPAWPGEADQNALDDEARANYAAAHGVPGKPSDEVFRGSFLPFRELRSGQHEWAVPSILHDVWNAAKAVAGDTSARAGAYVPMARRTDAEREEALGHMLAGAGAGITGGLTRAALARPLEAGTRELGIFGGRRGAEHLAASGETRPLRMLDMLDEMERAGASREDIWKATSEIGKGSPYAGAHTGVDRKPRFEIDDSGLKAKYGETDTFGETRRSQLDGGFSPVEHKALTDAYPYLGRTHYELAQGRPEAGYNNVGGGRNGMAFPLIEGTAPTEAELRKIVSHEQQHGVQHSEGFPAGGAPWDFPEQSAFGRLMSRLTGADNSPVGRYKRLAGETEARTVEKRLDLTPEQRAARPPWLDYDVPEAQQIVRFGSDGPQMSLPMDKESRLARAREMGFDTDRTWYHATRAGNDIDKFKSNSNGLVYFSSDPHSAPVGASAGAPHDIIPVFLRYSNPANSPETPMHWMDAQGYRPVDRRKNVLDALGKDAVFVEDEAAGKGARSIAVRPDQIRHVDAAFDPAKRDSANILASASPFGGIALGAAALNELLSRYDQEK